MRRLLPMKRARNNYLLKQSVPLRRTLSTNSAFLKISEEVRDAVGIGKPVVALETTIYTHGTIVFVYLFLLHLIHAQASHILKTLRFRRSWSLKSVLTVVCLLQLVSSMALPELAWVPRT